jgi:maleylpyruvate isomerase
MKPTLYNQCRSGPSYRVRIALEMKGIEYRYVAVDIRSGAQRSDDFLSLNPLGLVPALQVDGRTLTQSGAIIEWLEETYPQPALLPTDSWDRAIVRGMAALIGADIQPLNNLRVQSHLRDRLGIDDARVQDWVARWIDEGFGALEKMVRQHRGMYCFGDLPTLADIYLVPQAGMARRLGLDVSGYRALAEIAETAGRHPAFQAARPDAQPDWT